MASNVENIFISYQWDIQKDVLELKKFLERNHYNVWMDLSGMCGGNNLASKLEDAIKNSKVVICCITKKYAESTMCRKEINYAVHICKPIVPLIFEKVRISELSNGVAFLISDLLYIKIHEDENFKKTWSGPLSEKILHAIDHAQASEVPLIKPVETKLNSFLSMFSNKHHGSLSKKITSPLDFPLSNKEKENRSIQDTLFELLFSSETHKHQNNFPKYLISASEDETIRIWSLSNYNCEKTIEKSTRTIWCLCPISASHFASGSYDNIIRIWALKNYNCEKTLEGHESSVDCLCLINSNLLASGSRDEKIKIWNLTSNTCEKTLNGHTGMIYCLCMINSEFLASGGRDKTIRLWELSNYNCEKVLEEHTDTVTCLCLVNSDQLASGSGDKSVKIWNLNKWACEKTLLGHTKRVTCLSLLCPSLLASGSCDGSIRIWDLTIFNCAKVLLAHSAGVCSLFLFGKHFLASGCADGTIKIWNSSTYENEKTLRGHHSPITCMSTMANKNS